MNPTREICPIDHRQTENNESFTIEKNLVPSLNKGTVVIGSVKTVNSDWLMRHQD